jgi:glycosyltransferase involved in cell wall biosynthesis
MSSMHVGTITFDWYPFDPTVRRLAETAVEAGHTVDVICLRQPQEKGAEVCSGVHTYRIPVKRDFTRSHALLSTLLSWCWFLLLAGVTLTWLHLKHAYDVIHVHNMPDFLVFAALLPKLLGAKVILEVQDVSPELMGAKATGRVRGLVTRLASWQERLSTAFADQVITVGWPFEQLLLRRGVPPEKLTIILNSADPKFFPRSREPLAPAESSPEQRPFILMYHGTVAERNGLDTAIRALALARRVVPQLRLAVQGRGEYLLVLKRLIAELGLSDQVVFSDPSPFEHIVDFIVQGDVGIIPYRCDGFTELVLPTKAYEYAWMQRPMIASDTSAIRSMFRPESIVLCDPTNPADFAQAIIDLYHHPEKRSSMVANAEADYQPYRWEVMAKRYLHLLAALGGKPEQEEQNPVLNHKS